MRDSQPFLDLSSPHLCSTLIEYQVFFKGPAPSPQNKQKASSLFDVEMKNLYVFLFVSFSVDLN